ncbi:tRNA (adenine(58)-N(1))-methyltransferase non-catalytic subunit TRM6 isoform X1 [Periplaneta americana]|uniref:tRNA (adenine(58)-N(1))-methyltransferase non-catalytic subunit TRM6 isoform X1 n=2 Tax=Periplaneta americana TaxID=6978 RepID=UPI0037E8CC77
MLGYTGMTSSAKEMSNEKDKSVVKVGDYIIIQRQNYTKLHKITQNGLAMLGKDQIELGSIVGKPVWTTYKMEPKKNGKRVFVLRECTSSESLAEQLKKDLSSGSDNRNIFDDGRSQLLSTEEIVGLRSSGLSGQAIVGHLIENSKTFRDKTEYSQEKYLKKKEKKYFEYVTVRWPTIRLISEIMFRTDPVKIMGLRIDTLSQIITNIGMHSHGTYMLYESGCQGLVVAAMLNNMSSGGHLIHIHPGNSPQKQAILAMNYTSDHMSCLTSVNIYSLLRKLLQDSSVVSEDANSSVSDNNKEAAEDNKDFSHVDIKEEEDIKPDTNSENNETVSTVSKENEVVIKNETESTNLINEKKRKHSDNDENTSKKPRWELETEKAADILNTHKADGLVIIAREHPTNILTALLSFVAPSRPFVVFSPCREPLLELYVTLKGKNNTTGLRVTETWLRSHQILPSRTHPDILTSGGGGFLLTGIVVEQESSTQEQH